MTNPSEDSPSCNKNLVIQWDSCNNKSHLVRNLLELSTSRALLQKSQAYFSKVQFYKLRKTDLSQCLNLHTKNCAPI